MSLLPYRATRVYRDLSRCLYQRDAQRLRVPTREAGVVDTSCQPSCHSTALSSAAMTSSDGTHSDSPTDVLRFRLVADRVGVGVDVRLQRSAVRWISVADSSGRRVTGIGPTARAAKSRHDGCDGDLRRGQDAVRGRYSYSNSGRT